MCAEEHDGNVADKRLCVLGQNQRHAGAASETSTSARGEKTATRSKPGFDGWIRRVEESMRCRRSQSQRMRRAATPPPKGNAVRNALFQESTGSGEQTAERRFRRVGCGRAIDGQSEQNTAVCGRPISRRSVCPVLAESFQ